MNVLHIICHDLGKHLGCYGALVESPHLDRLAADGVRFDRAFCSSPACSPSRMCAMSGRYAHVSGGIGLSHMGWPLPETQTTIVDDANSAGCETAHFGFSHERHPLHNHYVIDSERTWDDQRAENAVAACIAWLRQRDQSQPFYANVGTHEVHASSFMRDLRLEAYGGAVPADQVYVPPWLPERPGVRRVLARFQAAIGFLDRQVGVLMAALEELGRLDDTLVVFTTDHGIADPMRRAKGTLYDRGCEVALLMRPPRGLRGQVCDHLLPNIDLRPTFAEALGIPLSGPVDGRSCLDLLQGRPYRPHGRIFTERNFHGEVRIQGVDGYVDRYDPVRAVRDQRWHYLRWFDPEVKPRPWRPWEVPAGTDSGQGFDGALPAPAVGLRPAEELYDTLSDPLELIDLAQRPECRAIKQRLAGELEAWMRDTGDLVLRDEVPLRRCEPGWGGWPRSA